MDNGWERQKGKEIDGIYCNRGLGAFTSDGKRQKPGAFIHFRNDPLPFSWI
jgi:hypothetical protein